MGKELSTLQEITVPSFSGSSMPRRVAMQTNSLYAVGTGNKGSDWPQKVANQWGWERQ